MARAVHAARDPAWTADGLVSDRWLPVSPVSGRLDAFEWKVPLAELAAPQVEVAARAFAPDPVIEAPRPRKPVAAEPVIESKPETVLPESAPASPVPARAAAAGKRARKPRMEPVIPLVVPDDPGPEAEPEQEPVPEPTADNWNKLGRIFK
jgi:HemY protein